MTFSHIKIHPGKTLSRGGEIQPLPRPWDTQLHSFLKQKFPKHTFYSTYGFQISDKSTSTKTMPTAKVPLDNFQVSRGFRLASYPVLPGSQALGQ